MLTSCALVSESASGSTALSRSGVSVSVISGVAGVTRVPSTVPNSPTTQLASITAGAYKSATVLTGVAPPPAAGAGAPLPAAEVTGGRIVLVGDSAQLSTAIGEARAGDQIELAGTTYSGTFEIKASGTAQQPIVLRSQGGVEPVFVGDSSVRLLGAHLVVQGLTFRGTVSRAIDIRGTDNRVTRSVFDGVGDGSDGSSTGVIVITQPDGVWDGGSLGLNPPISASNTLIDGNVFLQPANTPIWQNHGLTGNRITQNAIVGPHRISGGESMAIKIGYGFAAETTGTEISNNTIVNWAGDPYVIGIKSSGTVLRSNLLTEGRIELRYGDRNTVEGNVVLNGDLHAGGAGDVIRRNYVRTVTSRDGFGPFVMHGRVRRTIGDNKFDGIDGRPPYYREFTDGTVESNTFISNDPLDYGTVSVIGYNDADWSSPPTRNRFKSNTFIRTQHPERLLSVSGDPAPTTDVLALGNVWTDNNVQCLRLCLSGQVTIPKYFLRTSVGVPGGATVRVTASTKRTATPGPAPVTAKHPTATTKNR